MTDAQTILQALECSRPSCACHASVRRGHGHTHCPVTGHSDSDPSLHVSTSSDGKVLVKCFGGCDQDAVLGALTDRGLWGNLATQSRKPKGKRKPIHWDKWKLRKPDGTHVATKVRTDFDDGTKTYRWEDTLNGFSSKTAPLYGVERLNGASGAILNEGEKAADALINLEIPAVGTVTGSSTIPSDETLQPLLTLKPVYLWADAAADGQKHMDGIGARLQAMGHPDIRVIDWEDAPPKGDAHDFVAAGGDADAVRALCKSANRWEPNDDHHDHIPKGCDGDDGDPIDLSTLPDPGPIEFLVDGFLPSGYPTNLYANSGQGKSYLALHLAWCLIQGAPFLGRDVMRGPVLFLD